MWRTGIRIATMLLMLTAGLAAQQHAADGAWDWSMASPMGEVTARVTMKVSGRTLSGEFVFPDGRKLAIENGTAVGEQLKFSIRRMRTGGGEMVYEMIGSLKGDEIKGRADTQMDGQVAQAEWVMKRVRPAR